MSLSNPEKGNGGATSANPNKLDLELSDLEHRSIESLVSEGRLQFDTFANSVAAISQLPRREFLKSLADLAVRFGKNMLTLLDVVKSIRQTQGVDEEKKSQAFHSIGSLLYDIEPIQSVLFSAYKSQAQEDNRFTQQEKELISAAYDFLIVQNRLAINDRKKLEPDFFDYRLFLLDNEELLKSTPEYTNFLSILKNVSTSLDRSSFISKVRHFECEFQIRPALNGQDEKDTLGYYITQRIVGVHKGDKIVNHIVNPYNYTSTLRGPTALLKKWDELKD